MKQIIVLGALILTFIGIKLPKEENYNEELTKEMAYIGVSNYCHNEYDWSIAESNPSIMYINIGEETEDEYQIIFRSYTGAFVNFYVNKVDGTTRMVENVPSIGVENEIGTININDYI